MAKKNELTKHATPNLPAEVSELLRKYAGAGQEDFSAEDFALPFLYLLQDLSPQVKSRDPKYIEGAKAGDFLHSVMQSVIDGETGIRCIPIAHRKVYNEWVPRKEGGGFVASHATRDEAYRNRQGNNDIVDTANWFLLIEIEQDNWQPIVLSCTSSKLKESRQLTTRTSMCKIDGETVPIFMQMFLLKSIQQSNRHGDFFNIRFTSLGLVSDANLIAAGADLREKFVKGTLGLDFNKSEEAEGTGTSEDDGDDDAF